MKRHYTQKPHYTQIPHCTPKASLFPKPSLSITSLHWKEGKSAVSADSVAFVCSVSFMYGVAFGSLPCVGVFGDTVRASELPTLLLFLRSSCLPTLFSALRLRSALSCASPAGDPPRDRSEQQQRQQWREPKWAPRRRSTSTRSARTTSASPTWWPPRPSPTPCAPASAPAAWTRCCPRPTATSSSPTTAPPFSTRCDRRLSSRSGFQSGFRVYGFRSVDDPENSLSHWLH
jgi:hypothetical protein